MRRREEGINKRKVPAEQCSSPGTAWHPAPQDGMGGGGRGCPVWETLSECMGSVLCLSDTPSPSSQGTGDIPGGVVTSLCPRACICLLGAIVLGAGCWELPVCCARRLPPSYPSIPGRLSSICYIRTSFSSLDHRLCVCVIPTKSYCPGKSHHCPAG